MIVFKKTPHYQKGRTKFVKNNLKRAEALIKALRLLGHTPKHPGLNMEKLKGYNVWTVRVDKANRLFFIWIDSQTVLLIDIGPHDKYKLY